MEFQRENYGEVIPRKSIVVSHYSIGKLKELHEAYRNIEISLLSAIEPVNIASHWKELLDLRGHWATFPVLLKEDLSTAINLLEQHINSSYAVLEHPSELM